MFMFIYLICLLCLPDICT